VVSFRFHLVSIVALFIALGIGIGMGATVIDKATVDLLHRQLDSVRSEVRSSNQRSDQLQTQVDRNDDFEKAMVPYVVADRLKNQHVVLIGTRGIDEGMISQQRDVLRDAGAVVEGTMWMTAKLRLDDPRAVAALQTDLDVTTSDPAQLRQSFVTKVNAVVAGSTSASGLAPLLSDGFLEWDGDSAGKNWQAVPFDSAKVLVASGSSAAAPNDQVAVPLVKLLAAQPARRVVAIESGREPDQRTSGERAVFLGPLRSDSSLHGKISTVDDIERVSGRVATVLAIAQLGDGKAGDYGVGASVDGQVPKSSS
jgi:hypothetical protein